MKRIPGVAEWTASLGCPASDMLRSSRIDKGWPVNFSTYSRDLHGRLTVRLEHVKHHATSTSMSLLTNGTLAEIR